MFYSKIIKIPQNIIITTSEKKIIFKGLKGTTTLTFLEDLKINKLNENQLEIGIINKNKKKGKIFINLYKTLILKKIIGVSRGFKIPIFLKGVGYRALMEKEKLILKLGYSHLIQINIPENIKVVVNKPNQLTFYGFDWPLLTQFVYNIKKYRLPEPYKGKGILYKNEKILRKEGKKK